MKIKDAVTYVNILKKITMNFVIVMLSAGFIVLFFNQTVASDAASSSSMKYVSRLERKQESLVGIKEDILYINENVMKRSTEQDENLEDNGETINQITISKEMLTEVIPNSSKMMVTSLPMQGSNVLPKTLFEEEMKTEKERK